MQSKIDISKGIRNMIIVVLGPHESGKTSFIHELMGNCEADSLDYKPTDKIETHRISIGNLDLTIYDTPGLKGENDSDIDKKNFDKLNEICRDQETPPSFIYCHNIRNSRYDNMARACFETAQKHYKSPANVAIVTTQWAEGGPYQRQQAKRQQELEKKEWKEWIKKGRNVHQYDGDQEHAQAIIHCLLENDERIRKIKGEIEEEKKLSKGFKAISDEKAASIVRKRVNDPSKTPDLSDEERAARLKILACYESSFSLVGMIRYLFSLKRV